MRRGRGKTVCARGADRALLDGRSTSPLDGMKSSTALSIRRTLLLAVVAFHWSALALAQTPSADQFDLSMFLWNYGGPFVTSDFAEKLGVLVMQHKYPRVRFEAESPVVLDKGDLWWVTFKIRDWPEDMKKLRSVLPDRLTLWIRKADGAILGIH